MAHTLASQGHVRVLVADGQGLVRAGLRSILEREPDITVAAEAATGQQAIARAARARLQVVLMDIDLPGLDAPTCSRQLLAAPESDGLHVLMLLGSETDESVLGALRAGASGVLLKDADADELVRAVRVVANGGAVREVMALVACGLSNGEIAERLVVSPATAKTHVSRALGKLDARDRAQLVVLAYEAGLVLPGRRPCDPGRAPALTHIGLRAVAS
jgi:DNA-binding NarL/FixJ family response regulator